MWGEDEDFIVYRRSGNSEENTQTSKLVGNEGKAAPKANAPPPNVHIDYSDSQGPPCDEYLYSDPDLSADYLIEVYST